jgi:hypothetical protein
MASRAASQASRSLREPRNGAPSAGEIAGDFADGNLAVTGRLKQGERRESALAGGDGGPDFVHATAGSADDAQAGDDWKTIGH